MIRYRAIEAFKVKTSTGVQEIEPGAVLTLPEEKALPLVQSGKVLPLGRVAYLLFSEILGAHLWVTETEQDADTLRASETIAGPIYTAEEVRKLKGCEPEALRTTHAVKQAFAGSAVKRAHKRK